MAEGLLTAWSTQLGEWIAVYFHVQSRGRGKVVVFTREISVEIFPPFFVRLLKHSPEVLIPSLQFEKSSTRQKENAHHRWILHLRFTSTLNSDVKKLFLCVTLYSSRSDENFAEEPQVVIQQFSWKMAKKFFDRLTFWSFVACQQWVLNS